jgi:hypothetical protein
MGEIIALRQIHPGAMLFRQRRRHRQREPTSAFARGDRCYSILSLARNQAAIDDVSSPVRLRLPGFEARGRRPISPPDQPAAVAIPVRDTELRASSAHRLQTSRAYGTLCEIMTAARSGASEWVPVTMAAIRSMNRQDRANLLRSMASWMTAEGQAPMLEMALDGVTGDDLAEFAIAIGKQTRFGIAAFDEPIANAARTAESLNGLRTSVLANFDDAGSDRFLLSTLDLTAADVAWLDDEVGRARAVRFLRRLI